MKASGSRTPSQQPLPLESLEPRSLLAASPLPRPAHVVVVVEENHAYDAILGASAAPYINSLAAGGATFTQSFAVTHPSQPNYLALFSGSTQGVTDDGGPHTFAAPNLGGELIQSGRTFAGYSEGLPSAGYTGLVSGGYARKHNPWSDFADVPASANQPLTSFPSDFSKLPTVSFVIPTLGDDMHDGSVRQGDDWLRDHLSAYATWAKTHDSLLVVTWDEDDRSASNQIPTIIAGQGVKPGRYAEHVTHYGVLRTLEDMYGLGHAGASAQAAPITDIWASAAATDTTRPTATLTARRIARRGLKAYTFSVRYADDHAVVPTSMDDGDLLVTGPNGYSRPAHLVRVNRYRTGSPRTASYSVPPPNGIVWARASNGAYAVALRPNQVRDSSGNFAAARTLGTFTVAVPHHRAAAATAAETPAVAVTPPAGTAPFGVRPIRADEPELLGAADNPLA
jgi:acid phosphatase